MIGKSIAHYTITEKIGAGGMGEVYRATDTKLKRDVALKVLPESFTQDPQRMARFTREAQVLASLNHPNIGAIHGLEEEHGVQALVLELIEGEDLSERIAKGPIPIEEALKIAVQISEALEAAHEKGIIHRDLKPANVKITPEGQVKVLDFGLAKALEEVPTSSSEMTHSPTLTMQATQAGMILGTAAYMSPEQARGKNADVRSDIWGFGTILFEMLSGQKAFQGEDIALILASVVKEEADWDLLPEAALPLQRMLARCLTKEPRQRFHHIADVRIAIDESLAKEPGEDDHKVDGTRLTSINRVMLPLATALLAAVVTWVATRPATVVQPLMEFSVPLPADAKARRGSGAGLAVSPDGRFLIIVVDPVGSQDSRLSIRRLDSVGTAPLEGTEGAFAPFFSPDSQWIGFFTDEHLMRVPVAGGRASQIADKGPYSRATWTEGETIVLGWSLAFGEGPLGMVAATGGDVVPLTTLESDELLHQLPHALPGGRHVLFSVHGQDGAEISVASLELRDTSTPGANWQ